MTPPAPLTTIAVDSRLQIDTAKAPTQCRSLSRAVDPRPLAPPPGLLAHAPPSIPRRRRRLPRAICSSLRLHLSPLHRDANKGHAWWMQVWIQIMVDVYINFRFSYMNQRLKFLWDGATSNFMETSSIAAPWRHHSLPLDHRRPASIGGTDT